MARTKKTENIESTHSSVESTEQESVAVENVVEKQEELNDFDEIAVESLIPNVTYKDNKNGDYYRWDEVGHEEYLTFAAIKDMYRNFRGYFENMWIRPKDERVVKKLNLERLYKKYDYLINIDNYTRENIESICSEIESLNSRSSNLKFSIFTRIYDAVAKEKLTDFSVIKILNKRFHLDLLNK